MNDSYEYILDTVVSEAEEADDFFAALESAAMDFIDTHFPSDDERRIAAAMGVVSAADASPSNNYHKRLDTRNCSPTEYAEALAADVLISDGLATAS